MESWTCNACGSPTLNGWRVSKGIRAGLPPRRTWTALHCSNPTCSYASPSRLTLGWANSVEVDS